jgi:hypothetical protein
MITMKKITIILPQTFQKNDYIKINNIGEIMKLKQHNVYITEEQQRWLKKQETFNLSGYVRQQINKLMKK